MNDELTAQDIKRIRKHYGLSQQAFARVLGIGEASIVRYENGQTPSRANANLIRAAENPSFMLDCLERDSYRLSADQREKAEQAIRANARSAENDNIMDINELYMITLHQEILNEKAALMLADLSRMRHAAHEAGNTLKEALYEEVYHQIAMAKYNIIDEEYSTETKLAELRGRFDGLMQAALIVQTKAI